MNAFNTLLPTHAMLAQAASALTADIPVPSNHGVFRWLCEKCGSRFADPETLGTPYVCPCNGSLLYLPSDASSAAEVCHLPSAICHQPKIPSHDLSDLSDPSDQSDASDAPEPPIRKYIIIRATEPIGYPLAPECVLVFDRNLEHKSMVPPRFTPVSAGFLMLLNGTVRVLEGFPSTSLNLEPRPQDQSILQSFLTP